VRLDCRISLPGFRIAQLNGKTASRNFFKKRLNKLCLVCYELRSLGLVLTAMTLETSPALAQSVEQVKPVFEHILPNTEGKSMIAVVVPILQGPNRRRITTPGWRSFTPRCCPEPFAARLIISPLRSTRLAKASTSCPARTTGSVRMRAIATLQAYWPYSLSILKINR